MEVESNYSVTSPVKSINNEVIILKYQKMFGDEMVPGTYNVSAKSDGKKSWGFQDNSDV